MPPTNVGTADMAPELNSIPVAGSVQLKIVEAEKLSVDRLRGRSGFEGNTFEKCILSPAIFSSLPLP
jgi:hypothetical protein